MGLFIGCLPLYGLHFPLCVLVCLPLRLDLLLAYLAANISNPFIAPFLTVAEVEVGSMLLTGKWVEFNLEAARRTGVAGFVAQAALGSVVVGLGLGLVGGLVAARLAARGQGQSARDLSAAGARTRRRYREAAVGDRYYVTGKLALDPVFEQIAALGTLGEVVDLGCGRGQLALFLLEVGTAQRVLGFDFDARKIEVAEKAAAGDAMFAAADLRTFDVPVADTVLLVDVLHYLAPDEQTAVLLRAAASVRAGGRLIVRETARRSSIASALTRVFEWLGTRIGYNRLEGKLGFRGIEVIVAELERAGFGAKIQGSSALPLSNRLVVAERLA